MADYTDKKAYLVLADGTVFEGRQMGAAGTAIGEVVFNTCTASYQAVLNDPTYYGQIVAQTYPLVGNRGVADGSGIMANGYIVREWCDAPADTTGATLDSYLKAHAIVGICGIDTRALTRKLRDKGYFNGAITDTLAQKDALLAKIQAYTISGAVAAVTPEQAQTITAPNAVCRLAVLHYGTPCDMLESLTRRGCTLEVLPADATAQQVQALHVDGIVFSDGPGDPDDDPALIAQMKELLAMGLPVFGVGLGHQMLALALGGKVVKMQRGHRGSNQPVRRLADGRLFVTTQNHGYCVDRASLPQALAAVTMENVNDQTVEAMALTNTPGLSVQFTPVDSAECTGTACIYDAFVTMVKEAKRHE